jgi:uncharacterized protein (DUF1015 family)
MSKIVPFKAIRAPRHLAHLVVTRPYYTYSKNVMEAKLESNRFSFMHIINPEFGLSDRHAANSTERFEMVFQKFKEFLDLKYLEVDQEAHLYVYRQTLGNKSYTGLICGADLREYDADKIKKHESTLTSREEVFVKYLEITGFNAEPVLLSHEPHSGIKSAMNAVVATRPEYEFTTTDAIKHELWLVDAQNQALLIEAFKEIPDLYIADGHHRSASSSRLAALMREKGCSPQHPSQYFLACIMDEDELDIYPFHRVVKDLNGLSFESFLQELQASFDVQATELDFPTSKEELIMVRKDQRFLLQVKPGKVDFAHAVLGLSTQFLTDLILAPILDIQDQKTSSRIEFVSGLNGTAETLKRLSKHDDGVAFILHSISMQEVKRVADEHLIMPPKSTWVEPKLRSGMTIYSFQHDSL